MKGKKEKKQPTENENNNFPSLNSVISNLSHLRPNKITYQLMNTNKPKYRQKKKFCSFRKFKTSSEWPKSF